MSSLFQDPLDEEKFDSIQYINQQFPTGFIWITYYNCIHSYSSYSLDNHYFLIYIYLETSLDDLNSFISNIGLQISTLDDVRGILY